MATSVAQLFGMSISISNSCRGGDEEHEKSKIEASMETIILFILYILYKSLSIYFFILTN